MLADLPFGEPVPYRQGSLGTPEKGNRNLDPIAAK